MVIWDMMLFSLVLFHAFIFRVAVLKVEEVCSSETLVASYETTWCRVPEDHIVHSCCYEDIISKHFHFWSIKAERRVYAVESQRLVELHC
jgi:hypothetical protein